MLKRVLYMVQNVLALSSSTPTARLATRPMIACFLVAPILRAVTDRTTRLTGMNAMKISRL